MDEIVCSIPWQCGELGCDVQWHKSTYWVPSKGKYTVDEYSDGNSWDKCYKKDVPSPEKVCRAWSMYYEYVSLTGLDPLSEFLLPSPEIVSHDFEARVKQGVGRVLLLGIRERGKTQWVVRGIPKYVLDYLVIRGRSPMVLDGFKDLRGLKQACRDEGGDLKVRSGDAVITFFCDEVKRMTVRERVKFLKAAGAFKDGEA